MQEQKSVGVQRQLVVPASLQTWVKLVVSLGLLAWIISKIPLAALKYSFIHANRADLLLAFFMVNLCMFISVLKWQPLLTVLEIKIPMIRLLAYYYAGLFANNFLPSSIGGDALRIYDVAKDSGKTSEAAASVVMERLIASLALGLTAAVAMLFVTQRGNHMVYLSVGSLLALCFVSLAILFYYPFNQLGRVGRFLSRLGQYKKYPGTLMRVLVLSFVFQASLVLANVFTFTALGVQLPLYQHFLYIPVIMAVSMLPLSINGLGIREGMYVLLYGYVGVDSATSILCSLLFFVQITLSSLGGGLMILFRK